MADMKLKALFRQFMSFGAIGVMNTAVFYALYLALLSVLEPSSGFYLAYIVSMIFGVLMNLRFTFQKRITFRKAALLMCVYILSMFAGGLVLDMLINLSVAPELAGLLTIGVTIILNFFGMKAVADQ